MSQDMFIIELHSIYMCDIFVTPTTHGNIRNNIFPHGLLA